ncbi:aminotransferase class-III family protein [Burkholderia pseudomallei NCTC 13179]|nr:aminotransferase class-III family protein [Burkholderia pseudomallei NCTC 13179]
MAAAHAVLDVIDEEKLAERATVLGDKLKAKLAALRAELPQIVDVRGPGAMVAAEFVDPHTRASDAAFTKRVQTLALERGLLLLICGVDANVIRFLFPLTIEDAVFDEALGILESVLREAVGVPA